ncbi:unnamed protein product [Acanthoscelides obtectus]|uniref:Uncharacterized protein n=1 Tax=Acanthoscelides obtectus TaxID=200917 RepID=A0A9P0LQ42_ACAOB|nr:unnamed protein product [Acanthoscelides obtectus]CAK1675733.1 hypothetical protein AOBTE_LOCUS30398 [Acanthoscelides obtectus]
MSLLAARMRRALVCQLIAESRAQPTLAYSNSSSPSVSLQQALETPGRRSSFRRISFVFIPVAVCQGTV